ncbi:MAG TPA: isopentenyl phosphate kinase [Vitreimonas sp.]|nr:isopentenyl phosphate kinase [Vitreimonas sp.]
MKKLTLIKLGGSIITNKEVPMTVREDVLTRLVREIAKAQKETGDVYIVGHGQGSFAHAPAMRYQTMDGFIKSDSRIGMAITQDSAAQLNRIVVKHFLNEQLPAVSFMFSNSMVLHKREAKHWCSQVLDQYLQKGLFPITGGDVIVDEDQGCTIWSTEQVLAYLAETLPEKGYQVARVIHVAEVPGVLDAEQKVVPTVCRDNQTEVKKLINGTKGFDVTGGMWHKIEESLDLADQGIASVILSGMEKNCLYNCLVGKDFLGTLIQ